MSVIDEDWVCSQRFAEGVNTESVSVKRDGKLLLYVDESMRGADETGYYAVQRLAALAPRMARILMKNEAVRDEGGDIVCQECGAAFGGHYPGLPCSFGSICDDLRAIIKDERKSGE